MSYSVTDITITTQLAITSKTTPVPGSLTANGQQFPLTIKLHGNWTEGQAKKPYGIKLDAKAALLGLNPGKSFVLLANFTDHSFVNTTLAMKIGSSCLAWSPDSRYVNVTVNGASQGLYQLIESVKLDDHRINEPEVSGDSGTGVTGTYLLEINNQGHKPGFQTTQGVSFIWDDPDGSVPQQKSYIVNWLNNFEQALYAWNAFSRTGRTSYRSMIDMNSFAYWYLIEELASNQDSDFEGSCKIYKTPDTAAGPGILVMGPLWDFDISFGNTVNYNHDANKFFTRSNNAKWLSRMLEDVVFIKAVCAAWQKLLQGPIGQNGAGLSSLINEINAGISSAAAADQAIWKYSYNPEGNWSFTPIDYTTYPTKQSWIQARIAFLSKAYGP